MKSFADFRIEIPAGQGGEVAAVCPECSAERKKKHARCLSVNVDKGVWHCNHCGWAGSLNQGGRKAERLHWQKPAYRKPAPLPVNGLPANVLTWFSQRGITEPVLKRNRIAWRMVYMPQIEGETGAIAFPYFRGGELVNCKYRTLAKQFRLEAGAERCVYGLDDLAETTIVVEGELDKLAVEVAAFQNCVSVPDGAPAPGTRDYSSKFAFLDDDSLSKVSEWIIAVDSDEPGQLLEDELARRFGRERCRRVTWPSDCKDANDVLARHGAGFLRECIEHAEPYPISGVFEVTDLSDKILHLHQHGWLKGMSTGWASLDEHYTVRPGELTVVTGIPGAGKSNFLDALAVNLARLHGWPIALFSPENQPVEDHVSRFIEKWSGLPFNQGPRDRLTAEDVRMVMDEINTRFFWILDDSDDEWTTGKILEKAEALVYRKGVRGLIIDPWNELEHLRPREITETEYVSRSLKHIRQFARQKGIHVWIVAHPAKLYRDKDGAYPVPTLYDISGSANWRNKADNGLVLWRDQGDDRTRAVDVHIQKIRFRQIGKPGLVTLAFNHVLGTYHDLETANADIDPVFTFTG